ncbi:MAG TPA: hypothetical protein VGO89_02790 [Streptomyces sp.]|nr:hypothetical protein [Streptomyces sp.]
MTRDEAIEHIVGMFNRINGEFNSSQAEEAEDWAELTAAGAALGITWQELVDAKLRLRRA